MTTSGMRRASRFKQMPRLSAQWSAAAAIAFIGVVTLEVSNAFAQGGPPLITDDPDTPGPGFWEINVSAARDSSREERRIETPRVDINYGFGERTQLKLEIPWVHIQGATDQSGATGIGDGTAGLKWRFVGHEGTRIAWSVYPQIEFNTARTSVNDELGDAGPDLQFPTELTIEIAHVKINGEVGRDVIVRGERSWISELIINFGARPQLTRRLTLLMSAGRTLHTGRDNPPRALAYVGLQFNLPGRYMPTEPSRQPAAAQPR
jgi:hypothetical protein